MERTKVRTMRGSGGGGGAGQDWVLDFFKEEEVKVERLVGSGVPPERARDLFWEAITVCVSRDSPPTAPRSFFEAVLEKLLKRFLRDEKPRLARTEALPADLPATDPTPLERLREKELRDLAEAILAGLSPRPAEVARLWLDGWTFTEIASELGLARSTVRSHWSVAREALGELTQHLEP